MMDVKWESNGSAWRLFYDQATQLYAIEQSIDNEVQGRIAFTHANMVKLARVLELIAHD